MASLRDYERKRDRKKTPEPFSGRKKRAKGPIFVVQRHDARALHYDFRPVSYTHLTLPTNREV